MPEETSDNERTLALHEMASLRKASGFYPATEKEIHFVGLGTAGCRALQYIWGKKIVAKYTAITETDDLRTLEGIDYIPFTPPRYIRAKIKDRSIWYPDMDKQIVMPGGIKELFVQDHRFILLAGLGGYTGTYMAEVLSSMLNDCGIEFYTICSLPFPFEGPERNTFAMSSFNKLRMINNFRYFDFKVLTQHYGNLSLAKAFAKGDEEFYKLYTELLQNGHF